MWICRPEESITGLDSSLAASTTCPARCFEDKSGPPAWKRKPSWYQVSANDRMIPPETQSGIAERIGAKKTITLQASHASLASQPKAIVALIDEAARGLSE